MSYQREAVKTYHDELVDDWKEEMDPLLVNEACFTHTDVNIQAGLSSVVLTTLNVQS